MAASTRARLTEAAAERFYRDGFRNVGLDQVIADVGISKTAFYKHFASKDELVLAVLEVKDQWLQETFQEILRQVGGPTPLGQLRALFDVVEQVTESDGYQGCIFINVSMEFPLPHEPAHVAAVEHKQAMEEIVYRLAVEAGAVDPRAMAKELCLLMEGAYVSRQVTGSSRGIETARRVAELVIRARFGPDPPLCVSASSGGASSRRVVR